MTTELMCAFCAEKIDMERTRCLIDDKPACVSCVISKANADMKASREEDRAEARANDADYDSDDWNSEDED
jgi:hypothetical protein